MSDMSKRYLDDRYKLSIAEMEKIRSLRGILTQKEISYQFGISSAQVSRILSNKRWVDKTKKNVCTKCGQKIKENSL